VNGQHAHTHLLAPDAVTMTVLIIPLMVPGSPDPVSPAVPCQGAVPIAKVALAGVATSVTAPAATQTVCAALVEAA
jgi:hypothetical protein